MNKCYRQKMFNKYRTYSVHRIIIMLTNWYTETKTSSFENEMNICNASLNDECFFMCMMINLCYQSETVVY